MRLHLHPQHPANPNAVLAFAGPLFLFAGLAGLAVAVHDAPVVHAAHTALTSR